MKIGFLYHERVVKKILIEEHATLDLLIGRSDSCNIQLPFELISASHAQLIYADNNLYLNDLGSTNGTYVNGIRIKPHVPVMITSIDKVYFSGSKVVSLVFDPDHFVSGKISLESLSTNRDTLSDKTLMSELKIKSSVLIGRSDECDIILNHPTVSRKHAIVEKTSDSEYIIRDLGSTNGTYVNGKKITSAKPFHTHDHIFIGRYRISFDKSVKDLSNEIAVRAEGITKQFGQNRFGLHETTFNIQSNTLLAIMGPSGCGKSTLLKSLNGDSPASTGRVLICGMDLNENYDFLKMLIGYVPQDDIVHRELTVEESLRYAAKLRLTNTSEQAIESKVNKVLQSLKIEAIRKQLVGKISGGQRKRVSIAVELLTDPMILFLDEPTSPLDPQTIEDFMLTLQNLVKHGTTVVLVTHKPEDLAYMDAVIFMATGGHFAYYGDTKSYLDYFGVTDTTKVYANLDGERARKWIDRYKKENDHKVSTGKVSELKRDFSRTNYLYQFWWLTFRYFNIKLNDKSNSFWMVAQAPFIAILICFIFKDIEQAVPFLLTISAVWFGTNNAAREIVSELPIYKRERMFNQGILPYILSKVTVLCSFAVIQCILFTLIITVRFSGSVPEWNDPMMTFSWMFIISAISTLMGLFLSSIFTTTEKVITFVPLLLIPQIMLAGLIAKIVNPIIEVLSYFTISRWGNEGLCNIQKDVIVNLPVLNQQTTDNVPSPDPNIEDAVKILNSKFHSTYEELFGSWHGTLRLDFTMLMFIGLILFVGIFVALKRKDPLKIG